MEERICGLIVAAGLSSRMGCFKPLLPLRGKTVIENTIDSMLLCGISPVVTKETFLTVCRARSGGVPSITFPTLDGYRKHPPLIDRAFIPGICSYQGPDGLRGFWRLHEDTIATVPVDDAGCWTDLDTYEQYRACLQRVGSEPA